MAYECLDLVGINVPCDDVSNIVFFLDELGISLAKSAEIADERYVTGKNLVARKIEQAKRDVIQHLTRNVTPDCPAQTIETAVCHYAERIAEAIWYRAAALIYKDLALDSTRYNKYVAYAMESALANALLYDSSFAVLAQMANIDGAIPPGQYQLQLAQIEPVRRDIEMFCCTDCVGSRYQIVIP